MGNSHTLSIRTVNQEGTAMAQRTLWVLGIVMACGISLVAEAKEPAAPAATPAATDAAMAQMKQMQQLGAPSEGHQRLEPIIGQWKHTVKWKMSAEAPFQESQGTNDNTWILGGRFVEQKIAGQMMDQPFEGRGLMGYDNIRKEYSSVWIDNMGTGMMTATAQYDPATGQFTERGDFSCPMTGEAHRNYRATWKITDNNHYTYEMYMQDPASGQEFKSMEISYERL